MARPQYPSDLKKLKTRPHTKVHHSLHNHRKTAARWGDPVFRGQLVGLFDVATRAYSSRIFGGELQLGSSDLRFISGKSQGPAAFRIVIELLRIMEYDYEIRTKAGEKYTRKQRGSESLVDNKWSTSGALVDGKWPTCAALPEYKSVTSFTVWIPKIAKKQGFDSVIDGVPPRTPSVPEAEAEAEVITAPKGAGASAPHAADLSGFLNMLKGEIPTGLNGQVWSSPADWFEGHREILIGEAQTKSGEEQGTKFNGAFRSTLMRYWNHKTPKPGANGGQELIHPQPPVYEGPQRPPGNEKLIADLSDAEREALVAEGRKLFPRRGEG